MDSIKNFIASMERKGVSPKNISDIKETHGKSVLIADDTGGKSLYFSFSDDGEFAHGRWYSCRIGEGGAWHSRAAHTWSVEDKAKYRAKIAVAKEADEKSRAETQAKAQIEAKRIWKEASPVAQIIPPYLLKKQIGANGARVNASGDLVVPAVDENGSIWTVQTINEHGEKSFLYQGRKQGCFYPMGWRAVSDTPETLIICEGFATGASIYEALGVPVAVAFDANNLSDVALALRKKHRAMRIILAADNDRWTFVTPRPLSLEGLNRHDIPANDVRWVKWAEADYLFNSGVEAAQEAGVKVKGTVIFPVFGDTTKKLTDFNDLACLDNGKELVKDRFAMVLATTQPQIAPDGDAGVPSPSVQTIGGDYFETDDKPDVDTSVFNGLIEQQGEVKPAKPKVRADGLPLWYNDVIWKNEANLLPDPKSLYNRILFLDKAYPNLFVYNEFSDELTMRERPPWWPQGTKFQVKFIEPVDVINLCSHYEYKMGFSPSIDAWWQAVESVAKKNSFNPAQEYFKSLKWDGVPRLGTWLKTYLGATQQNDEYLARVGTMWLVAGAARVMKPATKYDHMLVLEGKMNLGKSSALRELATFGDDEKKAYFCDSVTLNMLNNPKACQILQGALIVEFAELDGMDKIGELTLRGWITRQEDKILKNYAKTVSYFPRQFILAATTNEDNWLKDVLGSRRYHPVRVTGVDMPALKRDKDQLWAEAMHLWHEGYKIYLSDEDPVYTLALVEQQSRFTEDPIEEVFERVLRDKEWTTYADLWRDSGMNLNNLDEVAQTRMRKFFKKKGWEYRVAFKESKSRGRVWIKIPMKITINVREEVPFD